MLSPLFICSLRRMQSFMRLIRSFPVLALFAFVFSFFLVNPQAAQASGGSFGGGDGSALTPYLIEDCSDLQAMSGSLSSYYRLANDIDCTDSINWNSGAGFNPIGSLSVFSGDLDGNHHYVLNLYINRSGSLYVGLFNDFEGSMHDVSFINVNVTGGNTTGALVGYANNATIQRVSVQGTVHGTSGYTGGLFGVGDHLTVTNVYSRVSVVGTASAGGLAGWLVDGTYTNVYAAGALSPATGGLFGDILVPATVTNAFYDSEVTGASAGGNGTAKSTLEMKYVGTYTDTATPGLTSAWDFVGTLNNDAGTDDIWDINPTYNHGYPYFSWQTFDITAPTITSVSSTKADGTYGVGAVINISVYFSKPVTATSVTVTLETGATDRSCSFAVTNSSTASCNYTVVSGDASSDLTVNSISGTITDSWENVMTDFESVLNLAASKNLVIDAVGPSAVSGFSIFSAGSNAYLSWTNPVDSDFDSVTIRRSSGAYPGTSASGTAVTSSDIGTSFVQTGLAEGTYYYSIFARDTVGNFSSAATSSVRVDITAPSTPGTPSATSPTADATPTVTWTASTDGGSGLATTPYIVQWSTSPSFASITSSSTSATNSFTFSSDLTDGTWYVRVAASDLAYNTSTFADSSGIVIDLTKPVITLLGSDTVSVTLGSSYTDAGATANDAVAGDLTSSIVLAGSVNTNVAGTYTLTYSVSDTAGNAANTVTRRVAVVSNGRGAIGSSSGGGGGAGSLIRTFFDTIFPTTGSGTASSGSNGSLGGGSASGSDSGASSAVGGSGSSSGGSMSSSSDNSVTSGSLRTGASGGGQRYYFTRTLRRGSVGEDVRALQRYLNANGFLISRSGPGSRGNETTYFGEATMRALAAFQEAHIEQILKPLGLTKGTGILLALTRTFLNR